MLEGMEKWVWDAEASDFLEMWCQRVWFFGSEKALGPSNQTSKQPVIRRIESV